MLSPWMGLGSSGALSLTLASRAGSDTVRGVAGAGGTQLLLQSSSQHHWHHEAQGPGWVGSPGRSLGWPPTLETRWVLLCH